MKGKEAFTLRELSLLTESKLFGDPDYTITGYADLENAQPHHASFLSNPKYTNTRYEGVMNASQAGVIFVAPHIARAQGKNYLVHEDPSRAFQTAIEALKGKIKQTGFESFHPSAVIHPTTKIGLNTIIGPHAVIDEGVTIGKDCYIGAGAFIGPETTIGERCRIDPNVVIREHCVIGNRVIVQSGAVIGSCGFGYTTNDQGLHERLSHIGNVILEDDVEIGANSTIDRARFTSTIIAKGTKIDNLVVIGHNVKVGRHNIICGQSGIAGSSETGSHVVIAGQCGINGHIKLEDGVIIAAKSGVTKSLPTGRYGGIPAQPLDQHNRTNVHIRNLEKYITQIRELNKKFK
ncbi:UDP-3-O-[3-hydroxymyristoyl] glucosamine N-acyltransferase [Waddlia chondrophila 2032/99]|uniref:UDP-3-O-acylglucosamine N-acyltransferase n=1 Tax=Waddlia chondrophila 2032/99 TaxID=765953 RepID=F8LE31_9BACT|nr:UDP-3-O-[3-hydroxymyristoyl] glucosamine N-acyltransferase [Waddlia chondrophila 2032/99]